MFFRQNKSANTGRKNLLLLRAFLALQILITFNVAPVLALDIQTNGDGVLAWQTQVEDTSAVSDTAESQVQSEQATEPESVQTKEQASEQTSEQTSSSGENNPRDVVVETSDSAPATVNDVSTNQVEESEVDESKPEQAKEVVSASDSQDKDVVQVSEEKPSPSGEQVESSLSSETAEVVQEASGNVLDSADNSSSDKSTDTVAEQSSNSASEKASSQSETADAVSTNAESTEAASTEVIAEPSTSTATKISEAVNEKASDSSSQIVEVEVTEDDDLAFLQEGYVEKDEDIDVIYIDNDEKDIVQETIAYEELPTDDAQTRIKAGAQFPVVMVSNISSKTAKKGDVMQARLKYDLKIGPKLIAKKGSLVTGHIDYALKARTVMHSMISPTRWYRNSGCLGIMFDEIINDKGEHIALDAKPARKDRIVKNKAEGRLLGVNHDGQITGPWGQQLKYKAIRVGLNAALAPAGVFSFGAMPVALGVMGAVNPSFAFMKPVGTNVPHRRIKGFCWGFLSGIPGSWIIEDTVTKGQEALVRPGDEFLVELHQEFTGKVLTEAQLMPGASGKVSGDVDDERLQKTEKRGLLRWKKDKTDKVKTKSSKN